ncbi:MAG: hypothetical protein KA314_28570 [Chloroflexi bacterium]|nr:hypothetical protein [Chloroflexota bacterium]MBP8059811.1 hypothetical protein [Chloroflexota bacterium]
MVHEGIVVEVWVREKAGQLKPDKVAIAAANPKTLTLHEAFSSTILNLTNG